MQVQYLIDQLEIFKNDGFHEIEFSMNGHNEIDVISFENFNKVQLSTVKSLLMNFIQ